MTQANRDWGQTLVDAQALAVRATRNFVPLIDCMTLLGTPGKLARWTTTLPPEPDGRIINYFPKSAGGWPYDIKIWDPVGLREQSTEHDKIAWDLPAAQKACKSYDLALYFVPQWYDPTDGEITLSDLPNLPFRYWESCAPVSSKNLGPAKTTFVGPLADRNWGGVIGQHAYFVTHYTYGSVRENFYWMTDFGWMGWEHQRSDGVGGWLPPDGSSIHNTIITANPAPVDPCDFAHKKFFG